MRERPMSVMIFGILNIGWAVLGLIGLLISSLLRGTVDPSKNPFMQQMQNNAAYATWMKIATPVGAVVAVILLAAGTGLLLLQNWARIVSIAYGIYGIISGLIGGVVMMGAFSSVTFPHAGSSPAFVHIFVIIFGVFALLLTMVYPVLLIIFMTRPKVIAAFGPETLAA
jgi:hypothetical protein